MSKCIICDSKGELFLTKEFAEITERVVYYKCENCGFVWSKTHRQMDYRDWVKLNNETHMNPPLGNDPPYLEQATMFSILYAYGLIKYDVLDYASGGGALNSVLKNYFYLSVDEFDPYMGDNIKFPDHKYRTVINSAMFEHVKFRHELDIINDLVKKKGCLIVHTVVPETIPQDADWFYMRSPVHCAFHTNKSMSILMEQWGYVSSIYCPKSKCWVWFKKDRGDIEETVLKINEEIQTDYLYYKKGFVDYWK